MKQFSARYDLIFQQSMCTEENLDILKWFLEKILNKKIYSLKMLSPVLSISSLHERRKTVDVLVETDNERINIEVNNVYYKSLNKRNYGYLGAAYNAAMVVSKDINKMPFFLQINLTWNLPKKFKDAPLIEYEVHDKVYDSLYVDNLKILVYNMDYFKRIYYNKNIKEKDKHLLMLDLTGEELKKICGGNKIMEKFRKNVESLNSDKNVVNFLTIEEEDEILKNTFKSEGFDEGKKKSTEQIAKNLLIKGIEDNIIIETTGITKAKLDEIKSKIAEK